MLSTNMVKQLTLGGQRLQIQHFREIQLTSLSRMLAETAGNVLFSLLPPTTIWPKTIPEIKFTSEFSEIRPRPSAKISKTFRLCLQENQPAEETVLEIGHKCLQFANTGGCVLA